MSGRDEPKTRWSERRDMFAATREAMIVSAVVIVFLAPSVVRGTLERAGITSFAGVEFDVAEMVDANEQVADAEEQVSDLAKQLAAFESKLDAMSKSGRHAKPEELHIIASEVHSLKSKADSVDKSLQKSSRKMENVIQLMPPEKLRELAERNAKSNQNALRQDIGQIQIKMNPPQIQSAQMESLLIQPQEVPSTLSR